MTSLTAQPGLRTDMNTDAAHGTHFIEARGNIQTDAQLFMHAPLHSLKVSEAFKVFQALEQALLLLAGQEQDALIGTRAVQLLFAVTVAGTGWTGLSWRSIIAMRSFLCL